MREEFYFNRQKLSSIAVCPNFVHCHWHFFSFPSDSFAFGQSLCRIGSFNHYIIIKDKMHEIRELDNIIVGVSQLRASHNSAAITNAVFYRLATSLVDVVDHWRSIFTLTAEKRKQLFVTLPTHCLQNTYITLNCLKWMDLSKTSPGLGPAPGYTDSACHNI